MKKILSILMLALSCVTFSEEQKIEDLSGYKTDKLITAAGAREIIESGKDVVVIDVRPKAEFIIGNVKGSKNLWRPDMESQDGRFGEIKGMRASKEEMQGQLRKIGVNNDTTIILVGKNLDEYRLWWILDLYNGAENVKIVNGGISAFKEAGIKNIPIKNEEGNFTFPEMENKDTLSDFADVLGNIESEQYVILDTRSESEHLGKEIKSGATLAGAIPSKYFIEYTKAATKDGKMKSYDEILALYTENGVTADKIILPYCQSGVRSAYTTFVLRELLGFPHVKNYDGSWIEWSKKASIGEAPIINGKN